MLIKSKSDNWRTKYSRNSMYWVKKCPIMAKKMPYSINLMCVDKTIMAMLSAIKA